MLLFLYLPLFRIMSWWPSNLLKCLVHSFHIMNSRNISNLQQCTGVNFCFWHKLSHCDQKGVPSSWSVHLSCRTIVIFQLSWFLTRYSIIILYILCLRPGTCYYFKQTVFTDVVYYSLTHTGKILACKFNQVFLSSRWAPLQQASLGF